MTTLTQADTPLLSPLALYGLAGPKPGQSIALPRPHGSADSLMVAGWLASLPPAQTRVAGAGALLVTPDAQTAGRLAAELPYFLPGRCIRYFSDWETLAYEAFSPHQDLMSDRLLTLYEALQGSLDLMIVAAPTLLQRVAPPSFLAANTFFIKPGQTLGLERLKEQLRTAGYNPVSQVVSPGEYALRGGLVDLYPMGSSLPYRIELLDDEVDSVRVFDPDSQRTIHPVAEIRLLPGREYPRDEAAAMRLRSRWRETFEGDPSRCSLYRDAANAVFGAGIEYYLPLLFEEPLVSLFDFLNPSAEIAVIGQADMPLQEAARDLHTRYEFLRHDMERPVLAPSALYLAPDEVFSEMSRWSRFGLHRDPADSVTQAATDIRADRRAAHPLARLATVVAAAREAGERVVLFAETPGRLETLVQYLERDGLQAQTTATWQEVTTANTGQAQLLVGVSPLQQGFIAPWLGLTVVTEMELFADMERRRRHGKHDKPTNVDAIIRDLSELKPGDPVVHLQHGIGRYQGLQHLDLGEGETECLHLEYAAGTSLFVPVSQLHLIGRYSGADPDQAPLHSLGSGQWDKARAKAARQVRDTAAELLNLYARRAARVGHSFRFEAVDYERFSDGFGFEETPDQLAAIHAVVQDMIRDKPMDRLVCGDVGFGKTEVALRAAFIAVMDGKQVAVLCPTTLLAEQHMQTFQDRFSSWPVRLTELSRFRSPKEIQQALGGMASGQVDIVIGTHKLLSAQAQFNRLGLVIIDEEHRFGVRQKETLKNLRAEVDVLTLTATPIPRTLAMSLEGIRDFSIIATAPQRRLSIKTFVRRESSSTVREALIRELKRGGQAYVLHNEVNTMQHRLEELQQLVPEARFGVAHGQMDERDLERAMRDFHQQRVNVLLCTTIIETGINVPTANTMVIYRADRFGLAQLHQLRGRVGRSHHQAYAYLMVPDGQTVTKDAAKRLDAIQSMEELGSGFFLAMHDMEIRGAGEVLGEGQSGDMTEVGFQLYNDMLTEAVSALKAGREPDMDAPLKATTDINLHLPALMPAQYCADIHERLSLYKRLASAETAEELDELQEELIDRFGKPPEPTRVLLETHRLRLRARELGIRKMDATHEHISFQFRPEAAIDPARVIAIIQRDQRFRLAGPDRIRMAAQSEDLQRRMVHIREALILLFPISG